jgi:GT2 family glycosyltransferase
MKKVTVLIPYVRPELIERAMRAARENAGIPEKDFEIVCKEDRNRIGHTVFFQKMVENSVSEMVAFIADDCIPGPNYLKNALKTMETFDDGWGLVGFSDGLTRPFSTHWLGHRKLLAHLGMQFLHTGYKHCCCDVELAERCQAMGRYKVANYAYVEHDHPLIKGNEAGLQDDEIYKKVYSNDYLRHDRELLKQRRSQGWPSIIGEK